MTDTSTRSAVTLAFIICTCTVQALALDNTIINRANSDKEDKKEEDSWSGATDKTQKELKTWWNAQNTSVVVLCGLVGVGIIGGLIWWLMRRRKMKAAREREKRDYGRQQGYPEDNYG